MLHVNLYHRKFLIHAEYPWLYCKYLILRHIPGYAEYPWLHYKYLTILYTSVYAAYPCYMLRVQDSFLLIHVEYP